MNFKRYITILISTLLLGLPQLKAQNVTDLIISEATGEGDPDGIEDDFGEKHGWLELFNNSQGTINYGGCFLSDDRNHLKKTTISKSDLRTKLGPRQTVLFYADGEGNRGTYHVDFKIIPGKTLFLTSNDGRTIIDSLHVPENLPIGKSISKIAEDEKQMDWKVASSFSQPTPGKANGVGSEESNSQKMERQDPYGIILSIVSISVVFTSLILLWIMFSSIFSTRKKKKKAKVQDAGMTDEVAAAISMALDEELNGETYAAIGMALHQYMNETIHDEESFVITIRPSSHSDWKNKTQNFRQRPTA